MLSEAILTHRKIRAYNLAEIKQFINYAQKFTLLSVRRNSHWPSKRSCFNSSSILSSAVIKIHKPLGLKPINWSIEPFLRIPSTWLCCCVIGLVHSSSRYSSARRILLALLYLEDEGSISLQHQEPPPLHPSNTAAGPTRPESSATLLRNLLCHVQTMLFSVNSVVALRWRNCCSNLLQAGWSGVGTPVGAIFCLPL